MKLYSDIPGRRLAQVAADVGLLLWVVLWIRIALRVHEATMQLAEPGPGPEEVSHVDQERAALAAALARLAPRERLLLRLRYEQDLTLEEVARLMRLPDPFRANRQIQGALASLSKLMKSK